MTFGSLFSGIGGIDLGLERAGMECRWQVESNAFCRKILAKHWPKVERYGDIKHFAICDFHTVDLLCGGFPCQPVSLAGKGRVENDERWLWPEFYRVIGAIKPQYALLENVPGLLNRGMAGILQDLTEIGYDAEWDVISAAAFGAPHLRERLFLVAYPHGKRIKAVFGPDTRNGKTLEAKGREYLRGHQRSHLAGDWGGALPLENRKLYKPGVPLLVDGFPEAVDEVTAYGNAVVPAVAEYIGRRIMEITS